MSRLSHILVRLVLGCLLLSFVSACAMGGGSRVMSPTRTSRSFAVVKPRAQETSDSLAHRYYGDARQGWVIREYNEVEEVSPEQFVVIPLLPVYLGGLSEKGYQTVPVLTYSAFSEETSDIFSIDRKRFHSQLQYLKDNGVTPITLEEFVKFIRFEGQVPEKSVLITIDDVGQHVYDIAFEELKKFGFPATVFVCTDLVGDRPGALTWDMIREMQKAKISVGHRTKTLRNLARRLDSETLEEYVIDVDRELTVASLTFSSELGNDPKWFAYPFGAFNESVVELLKKNGFEGGFVTDGRVSPFFADDFRISRINVPGDIALQDFEKFMQFGEPHPDNGGLIPELQGVFDAEDDEPYERIVPAVMERADKMNALGNSASALELYRLAGTIDRRAPGVRTKAAEAKKGMEANSMSQLDAARAAREAGDMEAAREAYLAALRMNPEDATPAAELKDMLSMKSSRELLISSNETLRRIAEREYGNASGEILLAKVNSLSIVDILEPGTTLRLPLLSPEIARSLSGAPAPVRSETIREEPEVPEPAAPAVAVVQPPVAETPEDKITPLIAMAKLQFGNGLFDTAVSITNEILEIEPENAMAKDIQQQSYYSLAAGAIKSGSNVRAMRMLRRLPKNYEDVSSLRQSVQAKIDEFANPLYLQGVNYFINEQLEDAVNAWELTLQANPWHDKARQDLAKARKLLEAVRGL